jgi:autotransporter-associated beta strand protein
VALSFTASSALAQQLAFPGALGFGQYATGGRNGTVYHVTTLADSGAGSFRDAVSAPNRTIVFDVGGTITLASAVTCSSSLTIAGQTAPGGGIALIGHEISFSVLTNEIVRFLRIRPGSLASSTEDGINMGDGTNMIYDHVSVEFAPYNNIDAHGNYTGGNKITMQSCILADPIGQQFAAHTEASYNTFAWCYNVFSSAHNRNPLAKVNTIFVNNVVNNFQAGYTVANTGGKFSHDLINNYFITGPSTSSASDDFFQMDSGQSIYYSGNLLDSNDNGVLDGSATAPSGVTVLTSPWSSFTTNIPTFSTAAAYKNDVSLSGALPHDQVDQLVVADVTSLGTSGQMWTSQTATGLGNSGYGTITGGAAPVNSSGDGIADYWKLANGLNPSVAYPLTNSADGYTLLEHYLNWLAAPHASTQTNTAVLINLSQYAAAFATNAVYAVSGASNGVVTLTNGSTAVFVPSAGFIGLGSFAFSVNDGVALTNTVGICVTTLAAPQAVTWRGDGVSNNWDTVTTDWLNGTNLLAFQAGDTVTFDDAGSNSPAVNVSGAIAPAVMNVNAAQNYTFSGTGALNGSMTLTKSGSGTLTLSTTNTFTGGVIVNGGGLVFGAAAAIPASGTLTLNSTGAVTVTTANSLPAVTVNGANLITGSGNSGTGIATLNDAGVLTLAVSGGSKVFDLTGSMTGSGTLLLGPTTTLRFNGTSGDASAVFNLGTGNAYAIVRNNATGIALGALAGGSGTVLQGANSYADVVTYTVGGANASTLFSGLIENGSYSTSPATALVKTGTGTLTLANTSPFTGATTISNGILNVTGALAASPVMVAPGGTLAGTGTLASGVTVRSGGALSPGAGVGSVGTLTVSNNLVLTSPALYFDLSSSPSGANDQIVLDGGTLILTNTQNFQFNLLSGALSDGTYVLITGATNSTVANAAATNNLPAGARQTFALQLPTSGSTGLVALVVSGLPAANLIWQGTNGGAWDAATTNWLNISTADKYYNADSVTFDDTSTNGAVSLAGSLQPGPLLVTNNVLAYTFGGSGALIGSAPLTKSGAGTLTICTTNSAYTGAISVTGGTLALSNSLAAGAGALSLSGGGIFSLLESSSLFVYSGAISVAAGQSATLNSGALGNNFSGNLSSGSSASVLYLAGGDSFGGTSSSQFDGFTGTINIEPGATLRFSPNSSGNTYGSLNPTLVINGTLQPRNAGNTIQLGALSGAGTIAGAQSNAGSGNTLYVIGGNGASSTFSGVISSNTAVPGSSVIVDKIGAGTLTLAGSNTFSGGLTVSAGALVAANATGSATGTGDVLITGGATLAGDGTLASDTTVEAGATLAPGPGTLTFNGDLSLDNATLLQFGLGTNGGAVVVNGNLYLGGLLTVTNSGGFGVGAYSLFAYNITNGLSLGALTLASAPAGYVYSFNTNTAGLVQFIVAPATPPKFGSAALAGNALTLSGTNGTPLGVYYVLASTNLTTWVAIATNQFDAAGGFTFTTNAPASSPQSFFRIQLP